MAIYIDELQLFTIELRTIFCSNDSILAWGANAFEPTEAGDKVRPKEGKFMIKKKFNLLLIT